MTITPTALASIEETEVDPVSLAVIQNALRQVANEMDLVQEKASFSPIVSEALDRANGIYRPGTGDVVAQGVTSLPVFVGSMQSTTRAVIDHFGDDLKPGDIVIINDPYLGGSHLMDTKLVAPFYYGGRLWCFLSNAAHWADIGGSVPGGFTSKSTEIHQEGLRIPPVKLYREGVLVDDILNLVLNNIRIPEERIGDIHAQTAAIRIGMRRLTEVLDRYGDALVGQVIDELEKRSESQMRAHIATVPDGTYAFTTYLDSDGVEPGQLRIVLDMKVEGDEITFDFSGSSPPCRGPLNSVWAQTQTAIYVSIKHIFPDVPVNAGCFRPLHIKKPIGTFLHAEYPRPVAGCASEVAQRIMEAVFGAMGAAIPERMFAAPFGTAGNLSIGGYDPENRRHYVMYFFSGGGYGGRYDMDGLSNGASSIGIARSTPIELMEQKYPILIEHYGLQADSGGAGKHRGGLGVTYRCRLLRGDAKVSFLMDHATTGPHGLCGGHPGGTTAIRLTQQGNQITPKHLSKGEGYDFYASDWIEIKTPGGGGYGDPKARVAEAVRRDIERGYLTTDQSTQDYGLGAQSAMPKTNVPNQRNGDQEPIESSTHKQRTKTR
ncbi:MAG: hydantoinase B/oxoprolinase family protein [Verrucomicrobia bacterium]|nr:hydantoinase B/oxoprolinase family protein [Verrucomicrobiota bacterium]